MKTVERALERMVAYDATMNIPGDERPPFGDDYNALFNALLSELQGPQADTETAVIKQMAETFGQLYAALENTLLHCEKHLTESDLRTRYQLVADAQVIENAFNSLEDDHE